MKNLKSIVTKTTTALMITSALLLSTAEKNANASIPFMFGSALGDDSGAFTASAAMGVVGLGGVVAGFIIPGNIAGKLLVGAGVLMVLLDADGSLNQSSLEQMFHQKYPFLDNQDSVTSLASAVKAKMPANFRPSDSAQKFLVSLSEEEVRSSLSAENLDETMIQKVVADLQ